MTAAARTCRVCGCHDRSACWSDTTGACWWAEADLCSRCSGDQTGASRVRPIDLVAAGYPGDDMVIGPVGRKGGPS